MNEKLLNELRNKYHRGTMVKLISTENKSAPPKGTIGTVFSVDETGSILVNWKTGSSSNVINGIDVVEVLKSFDEDGNPIDIDKDLLAYLRETYQYGTRVTLLYLEDEDEKIPLGTKGTVYGVDTRGFIIGRWDNGEEMFLYSELDEVQVLEQKICPKCGKTYEGHSALSRIDNETEICPACGHREALEAYGLSKERIDDIIEELDN